MVADVVTTMHGLSVGHLMHTGEIVPHTPSEGIRLDPSGELFWDR